MIKNIIWLISCNLLLLNFISIEVHGGKGHKRLYVTKFLSEALNLKIFSHYFKFISNFRDVNMCCNAEVGDDQKDLDSKFLELKDQCVTEIFGKKRKNMYIWCFFIIFVSRTKFLF